MKRESELVRIYADDVLKACIYYLETREDAEKAFKETFEIAFKRSVFDDEVMLRINLFRIVREVCGSLYFPDENEEWLYIDYFKMSIVEASQILGKDINYRYKVVYSS